MLIKRWVGIQSFVGEQLWGKGLGLGSRILGLNFDFVFNFCCDFGYGFLFLLFVLVVRQFFQFRYSSFKVLVFRVFFLFLYFQVLVYDLLLGGGFRGGRGRWKRLLYRYEVRLKVELVRFKVYRGVSRNEDLLEVGCRFGLGELEGVVGVRDSYRVFRGEGRVFVYLLLFVFQSCRCFDLCG